MGPHQCRTQCRTTAIEIKKYRMALNVNAKRASRSIHASSPMECGFFVLRVTPRTLCMSGIRVLLNYFGIISLYHCLLCLFVYQVSQLVNYYAFAWLGVTRV